MKSDPTYHLEATVLEHAPGENNELASPPPEVVEKLEDENCPYIDTFLDHPSTEDWQTQDYITRVGHLFEVLLAPAVSPEAMARQINKIAQGEAFSMDPHFTLLNGSVHHCKTTLSS